MRFVGRHDPPGHIPLPYEGTDAGDMKFGRNTKRTLRIQFVLGTGTITVDVGRGPEVKMTLPVMTILIYSTDRSRSRRWQGPVLKRTASV